MSLNGKVVLITGAGRGIGLGIAKCFVQQGASVIVTDLDGAMTRAAELELGENAMGLVADAASQEAMRDAVSQLMARYGKLDVLVNNAGIGGPTTQFDEISASDSAFLSMSDAVWDEQLMFNLRTAFSSSNAVVPHLSQGGSIINIASIAALGPTTSLPAYGAAKTLAMELAPRRIRVNCICPGLLWTRAWELLTTQMQANQPELANMSLRQIFETVVAEMTPLGGEQTPEDIGNLAVFYASDKARMITGQVVAVDGGISTK
jgi:3-oxoacyl-[acyl-carrier protein] reductase